jgi:hypothetical protein
MHVYLTRSSDRDAKRDGISDEDCKEAIRKAERALIDADLGEGLIKQRIPRGNQGAAKGSRAVVLYNASGCPLQTGEGCGFPAHFP